MRVGYTEDFPIIQYVDDTLLIMKACPRQLIVLRVILNTFVVSTSLKVNYSKSNMFPSMYLRKGYNIWLQLSTVKWELSLHLSWSTSKYE
jgi:hypothetical protein